MALFWKLVQYTRCSKKQLITQWMNLTNFFSNDFKFDERV